MFLPLFALVASIAAAAPAPQAPSGDTYSVVCTFSNPAYSGDCTVTEEVSTRLAPRAACGEVLACLNDARCSKTYCNATTVRRGWRLVTAKRAGSSD